MSSIYRGQRYIQKKLRWMVLHLLPDFVIRRLTKCEEIAFRLACNEGKMTRIEKLQLRFHLFFCHSCWVYNKQMELVEKGVKKYYHDIDSKITEEEKKERVEKIIKQCLNKHCCQNKKD